MPWAAVDEALAAAGSLDGKPVIDTTNQFGPDGVIALPDGLIAAAFNARRAEGAHLVESYNTLTAGVSSEAAGRTGADRVGMFLAGEDAEAKRLVAGPIADSGFDSLDVGGWELVWIMEAPRRPGAVYGEAYRPEGARAIAEAVRRDPIEASRLPREAMMAG